MYCNLGQNQFFDDAGAPLSAGRVKILAKGSDTLLPIFEDNGGSMVPMQNPVITANDGRIPTVFWPAALVDVVVEKSNGDGTYTELDSYVAGIDMSGSAAESGVATIAELRTVKPSAGMCVNVDGYYRSGDCPSRRYLWVKNASNYDDGGYIIASTVDNGGRWVMLWEGERLPASLYGVMCGHRGYEHKENIGNLFDVGKSVSVANLVFIPTPEIIEFDGRMAAGGSDMSPITYGLDGRRLVTIHRIAVAAVHNTLTTISLCQIHCSGLRGESWTNAEWLIDQDWNTNDQMERINTLWFNGNTSAIHNAFMACVACSKVKVVELCDGSLYPTLTNTDSFSGKLVIDHVSNDQSPAYGSTESIVYLTKNGHVSIRGRFTASYIESLGALRSNGALTVVGKSYLTGGMSSTSGTFDNVISQLFLFNENSVAFSKEPNRGGMLVPKGIQLENSPINLGNNFNSQTSRMFYEFTPLSGNVHSVNLRTDTSGTFVNSQYRLHDVVTITNSGEGTVSVTYAGNAGNVVVLNQWDACSFVKLASGAWAKMSPA